MADNLIPRLKWTAPVANHTKTAPYTDFPLVYNATVTLEPFFVDHDFTFVTSDSANTTLYKWTGVGWVAVSGITNPDVLGSRGWHAVTTATDAYVAITEHVS